MHIQEDIVWRFGAPPDYTVANYAFATGKTKAHAPGSLEMIVENLVKTWEMERSHKSDPTQHKTVDPPMPQAHMRSAAAGAARRSLSRYYFLPYDIQLL